MSISIRIDEELYNQAKKVASAEFRSVARQMEYWMVVGKAALDNPDLPISFIRDTVISKRQDRSLREPFYPDEA